MTSERISVLYVDDEAELLELTRIFLEKMGQFRVTTAISGEDALGMLDSGSFDVIVSDYQMPGMDGLDLLKTVRIRSGDIPFILFTGRGREEVVIEAINNGADFYLQKGGDPRSQFAELAHKITRASERRKTKVAIQRSEEKYRELVENANTIILKFDPNGNITFFNKHAQEFFGYSPDEILGKPANATIIPARESGSNRDLHTLIRNIIENPEQYRDNINENIKRSGERVWIQWWNKPLFDESGTFEGILAIGNNITDKRRIEAAIQKHKMFLDNSRDAIFFFRQEDGKLKDFNRAALTVYGYSMEELQEKTIFDFRYNDDVSVVRNQLDKAAENGIVFETVHRKKDGSSFSVEVSMFAQFMDNESIVISIVRDISERKRVDDALRQANRKLNLLSSMTRHDILNQIMVLEGLFVFAQDNLKNPKKLEEIFEREKKIARNVQRQILFTRDYEHLGVKTPLWQNITTGLTHSASTLSFKGVTWHESINHIEIFADPLLEKVCYNLIDNSIRHGGGSMTRITVSSEEFPDHLSIIFEDNGTGVPENEKARLFERGVGRNTGLGLFLAREILAITGISIRETGIPGNGARFEILVPRGTYRIITTPPTGSS